MRTGGSNLETVQRRRSWLVVYIVSGAFLFGGLGYIAWKEWVPNTPIFSTRNETPTKEAQSGIEVHSVKVMKPLREDMEHTMTLPANVSAMYRATFLCQSVRLCKMDGLRQRRSSEK